MKVYIDTNVLVSAFATRGLCADVLHAVLAEHELVVGETVLVELRRIVRQKIKLSAEAVAEVETFLRQQALVVPAAPLLTIEIRDPDDAPILAEAVANNVSVLITGDHDLLEIAAAAPVPIVTPRGFWELLRTAPDAK